jgi:xyloglucan:xyloglucosyl transferase
MAFFLFLLVILMVPSSNAQWPPSPGYWPSSKFRSQSFYEGYRNLWGPTHQSFDQNALTIWLDRTSGLTHSHSHYNVYLLLYCSPFYWTIPWFWITGSGFKSVRPFRSGYFGASIKLQPGYTAGVITAFYVRIWTIICYLCVLFFIGLFNWVLQQWQLSNNEAHPGFHDEVDIEFLGTTFGKPYTLQTNVYIRGSGDGRIIGREMKFHLWFDPTQNFHHYAILWSPKELM